MRMVLAKLHQLVEIRIQLTVDHSVDELHVGCRRQDVGHLVHHGGAVDDDHLGVAVAEDVAVVFLADGGINGHGNGAHLADGHVEHVPFGAVGQDQGHLVAFLNAQLDEGIAQVVGAFHVILDAVFHPFFILLASEGDLLVGVLLHVVLEKVKNSLYFHIDILWLVFRSNKLQS